jgi:3-hydroxyisobutyrate dehydrogenase-like beta-hydroxyacid dehydrogenase
MKPRIALVAAGAMGAAIGHCLAAAGLEVTTCLAGRSPATRVRAAAAGLRDAPFEALGAADVFLSIVPPADAESTAAALLATESWRHPGFTYADCNAVSPATARRIGELMAAAGCAYIDATIIGKPPEPGVPGTVLYAAGADCAPLEALNAYGLEVHGLGSQIGAAAGLKMAYAGITKGLTGLAAAMMLAATRDGAAAALHIELTRSQPQLLAWFERQLPLMPAKAYRWEAEMEEIADFLGKDPAAAQVYRGLAAFYARLAGDLAGDKHEVGALAAFLDQKS